MPAASIRSKQRTAPPCGAEGPPVPRGVERDACWRCRDDEEAAAHERRRGDCPSGLPSAADSQIYVTLAARPDLDGRYTVFGHIIAGDDVVERLQRGDVITRMYVKE